MFCFGLLLLFLSVNCEIALIPNLTLVIDSNFRSIHCLLTDDSLNTAIAWKLPTTQPVPASEYLSFGRFYELDCDMKAEEACLKSWTDAEQWQYSTSLSDGGWEWDGVLDHRWEKLPTIQVSDKYELDTKDFPKTFRLPFSVQTANDVTLEVCAKHVGCASYTIFADDKVSGVPFNGSDWAHYILAGSKNVLIVFREGFSHFFFDNSSSANLDLTLDSLTIVGSQKSVGLWKFHQYSFILTANEKERWFGPPFNLFRTDSFCVAFFLKMCTVCGMELKLVDSKGDVVESILFEAKPEWTEKRFFVPNSRLAQLRDQSNYNTTYRLLFHGVHFSPHPFWAVDDVRQCAVQDVRSSTVSIKEEDLHLYSCYSLRYPTYHIEASAARTVHRSDSKCSKLNFGTHCTSCYLIAKKPYCGGYRVCDFDEHHRTKCTCSAGFQGSTCEQACDGSYGFGCREKCGECLSTCNPISGICDDCKNGYSGDVCKIPRLPILKHPPKVKVSHTYMTVQLENEEYEGSIAPTKYIFQYKRDDEFWQNTSEYDFNDLSPKDVIHLLPDTKYTVRGLLRSQKEAFEEHYVRTKRVKTTCAGITEEDVVINPQTYRVAVIIMNSTETCPPSNFLLEFNFQTYPFTRYILEVAPLEMYTRYKLAIKSLNTNASFEMYFTTKEQAPKEVEDFKECAASPTSVKLSWKPPRVTNGIIRYYKVSYKHIRYLRCYYTVRSKASSGEFKTENTSIVIDGLLPFSVYTAKVQAVTVSESNFKRIKFETLPTVIPHNDELPQLDLLQHSKSVAVYLTEAKCDKRKGFLLYSLKLCCDKEWCTCETKNVTSTTREVTYVNFNIHGFSSYLLEVEVLRKNGNRIEQVLGHLFSTPKSVPNSVRNLTIYYKTREHIYLLCLPPRPPSGEIEEYKILYECKTFKDSNKFKPSPCELWPEFLCFKLSVAKNCLNTSLSIEVRARNKELSTEYGPANIITTIFNIEKPDPPENFSAAWDNYHNLTLTWTHFNIYGPLIGFNIRVFGEEEREFKTEEKQLYTFSITDATPSNRLFITVTAVNVVGESRMVSLITYSPPKTPEFTANPYVVEIRNLSALITIPELSQLSDESYLYVVVSDANIISNLTIRKFLKEILESTVASEHNSLWIAKEYTLGINSGGERQFTLGSGEVRYSDRLKQEILNKTLRSKMNYIVTFLLSNTYHYKTRSNTRAIAFSTKQNHDADNDNNDGNY